jgi:exopolysaccharide production protein ExoY
VDGLLLGLGVCAAPASIAVAESLLTGCMVLRVIALARHRATVSLPRVFWFWLTWAALEFVAWLCSPDIRAGLGEIRHLLLIAALFLIVPALNSASDLVSVWRGIMVTATISSTFLIGNFISRLLFYHGDVDPVIYLRNGGLLHHWMIYGTVEILVFAALLQLWRLYPEEHWWLLPVFAVNAVAIVLSLTRMLWICCLLLLALHWIWNRSRWIWALPVIPCVLFFLVPGAVRSRIRDSSDPAYYSNAERLQMVRVGYQMVREKPLTGVGPGRVNKLYTTYLSPQDPVPAYHGHLHNNAVQLAAEFGLPVIGAALVFVVFLFRDLARRCRFAASRDQTFLCHTALLGLAGFVAAGMFEYTYGHSLGLILLAFTVLPPLLPMSDAVHSRVLRTDQIRLGGIALAATDRVFGIILSAALSPVTISAAAMICVLSGRSPLVAHARIGQYGRPFWMWKLRTMWPRAAASHAERCWLQRIAADPIHDDKLEDDPRVTSRFAAFCRRHSIDELPQLVHVVRGEMSLVGPRPVTRGELAKHYGARSERVLSVKPGLTGYWQTQGRNRLSYPERVALDLALVKDLSFRTYWRVVFKTIPEVLKGKNAR